MHSLRACSCPKVMMIWPSSFIVVLTASYSAQQRSEPRLLLNCVFLLILLRPCCEYDIGLSPAVGRSTGGAAEFRSVSTECCTACHTFCSSCTSPYSSYSPCATWTSYLFRLLRNNSLVRGRVGQTKEQPSNAGACSTFRCVYVSSSGSAAFVDAGGSSCPVKGPFSESETCVVCQNMAACIRETGQFLATCFKGVEFSSLAQASGDRHAIVDCWH